MFKSFSTPGRGERSRGDAFLNPNIEQRATQLLAEAQPGARGPSASRYLPDARRPPSAADALRDQVQSQIGASGVDLAEHAALRQAAARANNAGMGKVADYGPEPRPVDPRLTVQFRNEMGRRALTPTDILSRQRRNPLDVLG